MRYNKVEYSTSVGLHCTMHDIRVPFCMPAFPSSKIIQHLFHADNDIDELVIGYDMIIGCDLMVQLGMSAKFKRHVLQWDGVTVPMKEPRGLIWK